MSSASKNIFIYSANYLPNIGGVEKYTFHLAQQLERIGHHTTIVTNNVFDLPIKERLACGAQIYRLPCYPLIRGRLPLPRRNTEFKSLIAEIADLPVDNIVINTRFYPHTLIGVSHATQKGIRPIIIDHGSAYLTLDNPVVDAAIKLHEHGITAKLKKTDVDFYGVSQASAEWLKTFGIEAKGVLSNAIDADAYLAQSSCRDYHLELALPNDAFLASFTGRLIPEKGILPLLEAASDLQANSNIHFLLAGDGPLRQTIEERDLPNIHLLGRLDSADISALLQQSNAFCLPTRSEGFSTSLLEAAACFTTPIITNVGGVPEMIPNDDFGIILSKASPDEISHAVLALSHNPRRNKTIATNVGKRVRSEFSWAKTADKVLCACELANRPS